MLRIRRHLHRPPVRRALLRACAFAALASAQGCAPPQPPAAGTEWDASACVFLGSDVRAVRTDSAPLRVTDAAPSARVYPRLPPPYGEKREWFRALGPVTFQGRRYWMYGLPRALHPDELRRVGEMDGIALYAGADDTDGPSVLYVATEGGCKVVPYNHLDSSEPGRELL